MNGRPEGLAPLARTAGLVVRELDGEVLIFDRENDAARCLDSVTGHVWKRCDGPTPVTRIAADLGLDVHAVYCALAELSRSRLLDETARLGVISRGQMMKRAGAAIVTIPVITTLASTPGLAQAAGNGWGSNFSGNNLGSATNPASGTSGVTTQGQASTATCPSGQSSCSGGPVACGITTGQPCVSGVPCCGNPNNGTICTLGAPNCHPGCCVISTDANNGLCGVCSSGHCQLGGNNYQTCSG